MKRSWLSILFTLCLLTMVYVGKAAAQPRPAQKPKAVEPQVDLGPEVPLPYTTDFASADALKVWKIQDEPQNEYEQPVTPSQWEVKDGRLAQTAQDKVQIPLVNHGATPLAHTHITVGSKDWKDYEVQVKVNRTVTTAGEVGVLVGYQSRERHYRITFGVTDIRIERREKDRMTLLDMWRAGMPWSSSGDVPVPVRVVFAYGRIAVWVKNEQLMNVAEAAIPSGKAGLFAALSEDVEFMQFSVQPVSDPQVLAPRSGNVLWAEAGAGAIAFNYPNNGYGPSTFMSRENRDAVAGFLITRDTYAPPYETVFRFANGWWAHLDRLTILKYPYHESRPRQIEVWTSLFSPLEGFEKVTSFTVSNKEGEEEFPLGGVWARYLKLRVLSSYDPDTLEIVNVQAIGTLHPAPPDQPAPVGDDLQEVEVNDTPAHANPLPFGKSLAGALASDTDKDVFKITVPPGPGDTLRLDVEPRSAGAPALSLTDAAGKTVATVPSEEFTGRPTRLEWKLTPGDYWVTLTRPPASLVILFDDSDSIQAWLNIVRKLLLVNLEKLAGRVPIKLIRYAATPFPLTDFTTNAAVLRAAVEKGQGQGGSTDSLSGAREALDALRPRGGNRIVLWILDILAIDGNWTEEFHRFHEQVAREPVRLYMMGVGCCGDIGGGYNIATGLFQREYAAELVERQGGQYFYAPTEREVTDVGKQILAGLAGPTRYALRADWAKGEPVIAGEVRVNMAPQVRDISRNLEIVLDASGSMNAKLGDSTRFGVAKKVLADLLKQLPADTNVALRVFGHRKGGPASCDDTELLVPLGPVAPQEIIAKVNALRAIGETPLVANLRLAAGDLASAKAGTIVAITDGEESCQGDLKNVAAEIKAQGVEAVVNIVGFNLPNVKAITDWKQVAQGSGGRFFDTKTAGELSTAVSEATQLEYAALGRGRRVIAKAKVGQALRIPEGVYTIVVRAGQPVQVENVQVSAKEPVAFILRRSATGWILEPEKTKP